MIPLKLDWESVSMGPLPERFVLEMPDNALAPTTPKGTKLIFATGQPPMVGCGVLVQSGSGNRYVRRYAEGSAGTWRAVANGADYMTLASADDPELAVLAYVEGRLDGMV